MTFEERIDATTKCLHDFACLYDSDICDFCAVNEASGDDILFLKERAPYDCRYRLSFGRREICCCPTRCGIWKYNPQIAGRGHPLGFWVSDKKDIIFDANGLMEDILGIPRDQIIGSCVRTDFPAGTLRPFISYYDRAVETGKTIRFEKVPVVTPAGRQSFHSGWMIPRLKDRDLPRIFCIMGDAINQQGTARA